MKKLSKAAILALSVALVLGLVACPNKADPKPEPTPTPTGIPTATAADTNGFVTISAGSMPLSSNGSYHVTITKAFKICDHEVTQAEWQDVMGNNPSYFDGTSGREAATDETQNLRPVESVNWYMAIAYCNKRSIKESLEPCYTVSSVSNWNALTFDKIPTVNDNNWNAATCDFSKNGYRLPTEAEWEIAARGGLTGDVYAGTANESELGQYAWYGSNSGNKTHEVKKKSPNGYGLYDMSGNVYEWCWDWYDSYGATATDPTGPGPGSNKFRVRVRRGGCWVANADCSASGRSNNPPENSFSYVGLRLVRSAQ